MGERLASVLPVQPASKAPDWGHILRSDQTIIRLSGKGNLGVTQHSTHVTDCPTCIACRVIASRGRARPVSAGPGCRLKQTVASPPFTFTSLILTKIAVHERPFMYAAWSTHKYRSQTRGQDNFVLCRSPTT